MNEASPSPSLVVWPLVPDTEERDRVPSPAGRCGVPAGGHYRFRGQELPFRFPEAR